MTTARPLFLALPQVQGRSGEDPGHHKRAVQGDRYRAGRLCYPATSASLLVCYGPSSTNHLKLNLNIDTDTSTR